MIYGRRSNAVSFASKAKAIAVIIVASSLFSMQAQAQLTGYGRWSTPMIGGTGGLPPPASNPFSGIKGNFVNVVQMCANSSRHV
jgi:hypothetical protein